MKAVSQIIAHKLHDAGWRKIGIPHPIGNVLVYFPDFFEIFLELKNAKLCPKLFFYIRNNYCVSITYNGTEILTFDQNPADAAARAWIKWKRNELIF